MKIVVVGAGYAGTLAANRLARKLSSAGITIVNPRPDFVERIRLHQQVAGTGVAATPLASMLRDGITARVGTVDKLGDGTVALDDGESLEFDYAVLAVGSTASPLPATVPVGTWEGAEQARVALAALPAASTVTVVGGGPTGLETAAEVAEARPDVRVRLVGATVGTTFSAAALQRVHAGLRRLGVAVVNDEVTAITAGDGEFDGVVHLRAGTPFGSDLTLWAILAGVPDLAARSGLEVNAEGRAIVDGFLRSVSDRRIFVVGDCAAVPGARFACQTATPQATHGADTLARIVQGRRPEVYSMGYVGLGLSLGRKDTVAQTLHRDDTPRRFYVAGRTATVGKELATRAAKAAVRAGRGVVWLSGPT